MMQDDTHDETEEEFRAAVRAETIEEMDDVREKIEEENIKSMKGSVAIDDKMKEELLNEPDYEDQVKLAINRSFELDIFKSESQDNMLNDMANIGADVSNPTEIIDAAEAISYVRNNDISYGDACILFSEDVDSTRRAAGLDLAGAIAMQRIDGNEHDMGFFRQLMSPRYETSEIFQFADALKNGRDPEVVAAVNEISQLSSFKSDQLNTLNMIASTDITLRKFLVCADPKLSATQMSILNQAFNDGLGSRIVEAMSDLCSNPNTSLDALDVIRTSTRDMEPAQRMKASEFISPDYNKDQLNTIMNCIKRDDIYSDEDIAKIADPQNSAEMMDAIAYGFRLANIDKDEIMSIVEDGGHADDVYKYDYTYEVKLNKAILNSLDNTIDELTEKSAKQGHLSFEDERKLEATRSTKYMVVVQLCDAEGELERITGKKKVAAKVGKFEDKIKNTPSKNVGKNIDKNPLSQD